MAARAAAAPQPSPSSSLDVALDCGCIDRGELISLHDRIVTSATIAEAQAVALEPTLLARKALSRARWLAPRSDSIRAAEDRLVAYQGGAAGRPQRPREPAALGRPRVRVPTGWRSRGLGARLLELFAFPAKSQL